MATIGSIAPAWGQDEGLGEVIVTAMRREADDYSADMPAVGLRRKADFAVVEVAVSGDTRDKAQREGEIYDMIRSAIAAAPKSGVQLAYGERTLQPLTLANYRELTLGGEVGPTASAPRSSPKSRWPAAWTRKARRPRSPPS
ncbi:hypothetical protein [Novosphingobium kaempferiae]|uniref:hypothetical protein n=1 Tax=Novosphingobium kaempferiae TaxID=2896849 RepID=UPI001E518DC9|nr:hypothetical protein [Novosphingobium kaempferiae]